jgi:hypothetical protein
VFVVCLVVPSIFLAAAGSAACYVVSRDRPLLSPHASSLFSQAPLRIWESEKDEKFLGFFSFSQFIA